ncbi:hypothetical protein ACFL08_05185 [Patescibacteria group bacterium]
MRKLKIKNKYILALLLIVVLGGFLRFYKLGEKVFVADEFLGVNTVHGFLETGEWKRWDFNRGQLLEDEPYYKNFFDFDFWGGGETSYTRAWMYNWQIAQVLKFFPDDEESSFRITSALWGIISIMMTYFIAFKFTKNRVISLIAAFLMAISLDNIVFSRKVRMYSMFMPVFLVFSYYVFQFLESKRKCGIESVNKVNKRIGLNLMYFIPVILLGLFSAHLHLLTVNIIPVVIIYFITIFIIKFLRHDNVKNKYGFFILLLAAVCLLFYSQLGVVGSFLGIENHYSYVNKILFDYSDKFLAVLLIIFGTYYLSRKENKEGLFVSVVFWVTLLMSIFFWKRTAGEQYIYFIKPFQIILISGGIYGIASFLKDNLKKFGKCAYVVSIILFLLIVPNYIYFTIKDNFYSQTSTSENPNYRKTFSYFLNHRQDGDILITREFRNYYFRDANVDIISLGGERAKEGEKKITKSRLRGLLKNGKSCVWVIVSDNDKTFITKEAEVYIEDEMKKIRDVKTRGPISTYHACPE